MKLKSLFTAAVVGMAMCTFWSLRSGAQEEKDPFSGTVERAIKVYTSAVSGDSKSAPAAENSIRRRIRWTSSSDSKEHSEEIQQLNQLVQRLVKSHAKADNDTARSAIIADLSKAVSSQFEIRQAMRTKELEELSQQLQRLQAIHRQREEQKSRIIEDRVQQLLRDANGLGWGADNVSNFGVNNVFGRDLDIEHNAFEEDEGEISFETDVDVKR